MTVNKPARRRVVEASPRDERDFNAAILDTVGSLIIVLDRRGRIVRFNRACEDLTGYTFAEVRACPFWDIFLLPDERARVE
ncbi:MAG TPA: PAS domain-containing protein, partial [Herpetosiphonaceae bacterium]|nr:PAS domain-containing protein [Herpetosiphonaceae bacterium]